MSIHEKLNAVTVALQTLNDELFNEIQQEAKHSNSERINILNQAATSLNSLKGEVENEHGRLGCCQFQTSKSSEVKKFTVTITTGALKQSYLMITPALKSGWMKPGLPITIKLPNGVTFETVAVMPNRLKERGKIGKFFKDTKVKDGDVFYVEEVSPNVWALTKKGK